MIESKTSSLRHFSGVESSVPAFLKPKGWCDLVRLGRNYDGGYVVDRKSVENSDFLLSFGLNEDWSFDREFLELNRVPIAAFDYSVSVGWFLYRIAVRPYQVLWFGYKLFDYLRFFRDDHRHIKYFVGSGPAKSFVTLSEVMSKFVPEAAQYLFLKIDIEGSEYDILDDLVIFSARMSGLAIEFHDVRRNLPKIEKFIAEFGLSLCHVHANNYALPVEGVMPDVLELAFTRSPLNAKRPIELPHPLDMPNNKKVAEVRISFSE